MVGRTTDDVRVARTPISSRTLRAHDERSTPPGQTNARDLGDDHFGRAPRARGGWRARRARVARPRTHRRFPVGRSGVVVARGHQVLRRGRLLRGVRPSPGRHARRRAGSSAPRLRGGARPVFRPHRGRRVRARDGVGRVAIPARRARRSRDPSHRVRVPDRRRRRRARHARDPRRGRVGGRKCLRGGRRHRRPGGRRA